MNLNLLSAGYTGAGLDAYYTALGITSLLYPSYVNQDNQGLVNNTVVYSALGSLVSDNSITTLTNAFSAVNACDLAERLFLSLAAIYESPILLGDVRCFLNGSPGRSIFIHIDDPAGNEVIHIETNPQLLLNNPWQSFKNEYNAWRVLNPCPTVTPPTPPPSSNLVSHALFRGPF